MIIDYYSQSAYVDWMIEWTAVCICHSDPSEHRKKVCVVFDIMSNVFDAVIYMLDWTILYFCIHKLAFENVIS